MQYFIDGHLGLASKPISEIEYAKVIGLAYIDECDNIGAYCFKYFLWELI